MTESFDRVKESCTVTGTGNITVTGAEDASFFAYSDKYADGEIVPYCVVESAAAFEIGSGVFTLATGLIARSAARVTESSNAGGLVSFGAGAKVCGVTNSSNAVKGIDRIASGAIPTGQPVIINADGTVSAGTVSATAIGSTITFNSDASYDISATYDPVNGKVVIAYRDGGNSSFGTAIVGTVSGTSISFGTPVVFESASATNISATYDVATGQVVIAYTDGGSANRGTAIVGMVSGTSISFGTASIFENGTPFDIALAYDSANGKVVVAYRNAGNSSFGTAIVGTVSGTSISFGGVVVFESSATYDIAPAYDSVNGKVVIAYRDGGNSSFGTAIVGTVSGTSISFGTPVVFESALVTNISATYDAANGKIVIAYTDNGVPDHGTAIVGTVSDISISFGTPVVFENVESHHISATYDSANEKVVIAYRDGLNTDKGTSIVGTVSGTSISFESAMVIANNLTSNLSTIYDAANGQVVISYTNVGSQNRGNSMVLTTPTSDITEGGFLGLCQNSPADTETANVAVAGDINANQSGLTPAKKYYIDASSNLTTTASAIYVGKSLSSTEILIGG